MQNAECRTFCILILLLHGLAAGVDLRLRSVVGHEVEPPIAPVDGPSVGLISAQQALLIQLGIGARTVELVAAVDHGAEKVSAFFTKPAR